MLASKFLLPITGRLARQNLSKIQTCLLASQCKPDCKSSVTKKPKSFFRLFKTNRCGRLQKTLTKCSKPCNNEECLAPGPRDAKCPKSAQHAADCYLDAYSKVKNEAWKLRLQVVTYSHEAISCIASVNSCCFKAEAAKIEQRLRNVTARAEAILKTNLECGLQTRMECLQLCNSVHNQLHLFKCENESGMNDIKRRLCAVENKVLERTETAAALVRTCKGCVSPYHMHVGTAMTQEEAMCILQHTEKYVKEQLENIERIKLEVIKENQQFLIKLVKKLEQEISVFSKHLKFVSKALPKKMKTCK